MTYKYRSSVRSYSHYRLRDNYVVRRSVIRDCVDLQLLRSTGVKVTTSVHEILERAVKREEEARHGQQSSAENPTEKKSPLEKINLFEYLLPIIF